MAFDPNDEDLMGLLAYILNQKGGSTLPTELVAPPPAPKEDPTPTEPETQKKKRCKECKKKLGLIAFPCKCGGEYCSMHRVNADHNCTYDYQADAKKALSTMLVKVEAKKLESL